MWSWCHKDITFWYSCSVLYKHTHINVKKNTTSPPSQPVSSKLQMFFMFLTCWLCWWPPGLEVAQWNTPKGPWPHSPWGWSPSTWSFESCLPAHTPHLGLLWSERGGRGNRMDASTRRTESRKRGDWGDKEDVGNEEKKKNSWRDGQR